MSKKRYKEKKFEANEQEIRKDRNKRIKAQKKQRIADKKEGH